MIKKMLLFWCLSLGSVMAMAQTLKVVVKQDGKTVDPIDDVYHLKKSAFQFDITSNDLEGFLVGVTTDENHYGEAVDFFEEDEPWFTNTGMSEQPFNADKEIFLMDMAPSYWYFSDVDDHRFDRDPKGTPEQWTATRAVTKFYDIIDVQSVDLEDVEVSIYILMFDPVYNDEYDMIGKKNLFFGELKFVD